MEYSREFFEQFRGDKLPAEYDQFVSKIINQHVSIEHENPSAVAWNRTRKFYKGKVLMIYDTDRGKALQLASIRYIYILGLGQIFTLKILPN